MGTFYQGTWQRLTTRQKVKALYIGFLNIKKIWFWFLLLRASRALLTSIKLVQLAQA